MPSWAMPRRWVMVLLGLVCALVSAVGAVFGWVAWTGRQTATIAVPADTAAPLDVARAYVAAINAHDCHAARRVTVADSVDMTTMWCINVRSLAVSEWRTPVVESPARPRERGSAVAGRRPRSGVSSWI